MELHDFVTQTLVQIASGIKNASDELKESSAVVNPRYVNYNKNESVQVYGWLSDKKEKLRGVQCVDFDVTVAVTEGKENKGGLESLLERLASGRKGKTRARIQH